MAPGLFSFRGELEDALADFRVLEPLEVAGDNLRTAKSHSMSTASCLKCEGFDMLLIETVTKSETFS